jgi:hypothetical protein
MPDSVNSLQASFWTMVFLQTLGSVDMPGRGPRKMPSPRNYVAIMITWGVLQIVSDMSERAARAAKAMSWVIVLAGMVVGPFGKVAGNFLNSAANTYGAPPSSATAQPTTTG